MAKQWVVSVLAAVLLASSAGAAEEAAGKADEKTLYALGALLARSLAGFHLSADEVAVVQRGLADAVLGKDLMVNPEEQQKQVQELQQERARVAAEKEKVEAKKFLAAMEKEKGAVTTESGLILIEIKPGTGDSPAATDTVKVHYHGTLRDGTVFDSSVERGTPATFRLNQVIPCWTEGVQKMKAGGKSKLVCPAEIAYGDRGAPPKIVGGAALVFEVELLEVVKPATPAAKQN